MSKVEVDPKAVRDEILSVSEPSSSKQDYQDEIEKLAREAMEKYPEGHIQDIVFAVVDEYIDSADNQTQANILHHSQSDPYAGDSYSEGVLSGLSFIHLKRDVWRKVWSRKKDSMAELVEELFDVSSEVHEIHVLHTPDVQSTNRLEIVINTPDVCLVGNMPKMYQKNTFVEIEGDESMGKLGYPFDVKLFNSGSETVGEKMGTTIYREDGGSKPPITPEKGILRLRGKLRGEHPECNFKEGDSHA